MILRSFRQVPGRFRRVQVCCTRGCHRGCGPHHAAVARKSSPARGALSLPGLCSQRGQYDHLQGKPIVVEELTKQAFAGCDLVIATTPDDIARDYLPATVEAGATVIDESGYWRMDKNVPLVIPEINPQEALKIKAGIISSPQLFHDPDGTGPQSARLRGETRCGLHLPGDQRYRCSGPEGTHRRHRSGTPRRELQLHRLQAPDQPSTAFRRLAALEDGYTSEEMKMVYETRKILGDESIMVCRRLCDRFRTATANRLSSRPNVRSAEKARELFASFPGIKVVERFEQQPVPAALHVRMAAIWSMSGIRKDISHPNGLAFWCVSDNLRKGAATNAVQIAELIAKHRFG